MLIQIDRFYQSEQRALSFCAIKIFCELCVLKSAQNEIWDCCAESNYVGSKNVQNCLGSNSDFILSRIERSENFIHIIPLL